MQQFDYIARLFVLGGIASALVIAADLRNCRQPMRIMNSVWILTGLWASFFGLWAYFSFGRTRHCTRKERTHARKAAAHIPKTANRDEKKSAGAQDGGTGDKDGNGDPGGKGDTGDNGDTGMLHKGSGHALSKQTKDMNGNPANTERTHDMAAALSGGKAVTTTAPVGTDLPEDRTGMYQGAISGMGMPEHAKRTQMQRNVPDGAFRAANRAETNRAGAEMPEGRGTDRMEITGAEMPEGMAAKGDRMKGMQMPGQGGTVGMDDMEMAGMEGAEAMQMPMPQRPRWQSVVLSTLHCGAGCTLADLVGEWFLYFVPVAIGGSLLAGTWVVDYALALVIGIGFQYAAIRGMERRLPRGEAVRRAAKADILSLTAWQAGMYGWMAVVIFHLNDGTTMPRTSFAFWFMMQIAMACGFLVSLPVNALLIRTGIKKGM